MDTIFMKSVNSEASDQDAKIQKSDTKIINSNYQLQHAAKIVELSGQ